MTKAKTMFTSESALDNLLAVTEPATKEEKTRTQASKNQKVNTAPNETKGYKAKQSEQGARQQLNIELEDELYFALTLRKAHAKKDRNESENSFKKIVEASLRAYLCDELQR